MARIRSTDGNSVLRIKAFLGLNENPDGDTNIKPGEFSVMRNFRITADRHLQLRPGQKTLFSLGRAWDSWAASHPGHEAKPRFCGSWTGRAGGGELHLAAYGGVIFQLDTAAWTAKPVGQCTQDDTSFFGFADRVYLLNGHEYMGWDGKAEAGFQSVEGYVPTTYTASTPAGGGTKLENVNRLTGKRRVKFSPDGKAAAYHLPEQEIDEIVKVEGTDSGYALDKKGGVVTFHAAPPAGTNTLSIIYRKGTGSRENVTKMRYAELYNGSTDARVFLYGDGSNKTIYSGSELEKGTATAEYFPDLFEISVGDANSPITAMVRHYARLLVFKPGSSWSVEYSPVTVGGGLLAAFHVEPVNRSLGNEAPGQVRLLENNPLTLESGSIYRWLSTGGLAVDARNASRISDRVRSTLLGFSFKEVKTFNHQRDSEFWLLWGGKALVYNYATDVWYLYDGVPFLAMEEMEGGLYGFTAAGDVVHLSRRYRNDNGKEIDAYAETGSMDFQRDELQKYSPLIYVALKPETGGRLTVTAETNRRSDYPEKLVSAGLSNFTHVDFGHWSFGTNRKPQVRRVKLKVKKAVFYKLIFRSRSASATATVLEVDVALRYAGKVK